MSCGGCFDFICGSSEPKPTLTAPAPQANGFVGKKQKIVIVGAGPVGCAAAVLFAKRPDCDVHVFERYDPAKAGQNARRSINLVLTRRGMRLADSLGLRQELLKGSVVVKGRVLHNDRAPKFQPYGREDECNYSVSREYLNEFWREQAEKVGATIHYNRQLDDINWNTGELVFKASTGADGKKDEYLNTITELGSEIFKTKADLIIGADGAMSKVRKCMEASKLCGEVEQEKLNVGYKEVTIPAGTNLNAEGLHIWPRCTHFLMGLANTDGSFTGTMYLDKKEERPSIPSFASTCASQIAAQMFWEKYYPTALSIVGREGVNEFMQNEVGTLGTIRVEKFNATTRGCTVIIAGDAAHPMVPFFGQGCNCGLEDIAVLGEILPQDFRKAQNPRAAISEVGNNFHARRKPNTDAMQTMALENFTEMRERVADPQFNLMKRLEGSIERRYPHKYRSRYALVSYSYNDYANVKKLGVVLEATLTKLLEGKQKETEVSDAEIQKAVFEGSVASAMADLNIKLDF